MPEPYQAVIFDMDSLIVDTENIYDNTYNQTFNELDIDIPREGYVRCVGHPVESNISIEELFGSPKGEL